MTTGRRLSARQAEPARSPHRDPDRRPAPWSATRSSTAVGGPAGDLLRLHRAAGNAAVAGLIEQARGPEPGRPMTIQAKLRLGRHDDPAERDADATAQRVLRKTGACCSSCAAGKACDGERPSTRRGSAGNGAGLPVPPDIAPRIERMQRGGLPLPASVRAEMEPRFGHDFSHVRIHRDGAAAGVARALDARAYTVGHHIAFGTGEYAPGTARGDFLLAHELAHVSSQDAAHPFGKAEAVVRRQVIGPHGTVSSSDPRAPKPPNAKDCGRPSHCPSTFCTPYPTVAMAIEQRAKSLPVLLAGIALAVDSRVVPLWRTHLNGGSPPQDLSSKFAADFAASPTTTETVNFLNQAIRLKVQAAPPSFPPGGDTVIVKLSDLIPTEIAAINTPGNANEMNFTYVGDIAGNLAGGIGKNQNACQSGKQPSPFNDERLVDGHATITRLPSGKLSIQPAYHFTVKDTIDLCPGNCGTAQEQLATVPISRFEATGISGDVPFTIDFHPTAPVIEVAPLPVLKPMP